LNSSDDGKYIKFPLDSPGSARDKGESVHEKVREINGLQESELILHCRFISMSLKATSSLQLNITVP
jgi:hypothetical protein